MAMPRTASSASNWPVRSTSAAAPRYTSSARTSSSASTARPGSQYSALARLHSDNMARTSSSASGGGAVLYSPRLDPGAPGMARESSAGMGGVDSAPRHSVDTALFEERLALLEAGQMEQSATMERTAAQVGWVEEHGQSAAMYMGQLRSLEASLVDQRTQFEEALLAMRRDFTQEMAEQQQRLRQERTTSEVSVDERLQRMKLAMEAERNEQLAAVRGVEGAQNDVHNKLRHHGLEFDNVRGAIERAGLEHKERLTESLQEHKALQANMEAAAHERHSHFLAQLAEIQKTQLEECEAGATRMATLEGKLGLQMDDLRRELEANLEQQQHQLANNLDIVNESLEREARALHDKDAQLDAAIYECNANLVHVSSTLKADLQSQCDAMERQIRDARTMLGNRLDEEKDTLQESARRESARVDEAAAVLREHVGRVDEKHSDRLEAYRASNDEAQASARGAVVDDQRATEADIRSKLLVAEQELKALVTTTRGELTDAMDANKTHAQGERTASAKKCEGDLDNLRAELARVQTELQAAAEEQAAAATAGITRLSEQNSAQDGRLGGLETELHETVATEVANINARVAQGFESTNAQVAKDSASINALVAQGFEEQAASIGQLQADVNGRVGQLEEDVNGKLMASVKQLEVKVAEDLKPLVRKASKLESSAGVMRMDLDEAQNNLRELAKALNEFEPEVDTSEIEATVANLAAEVQDISIDVSLQNFAREAAHS